MKSTFQTVLIILCLVPAALSAREKREKHTMPIREIDRPLLLPQRQSKLSAGYTASFSWDKDDGVQQVALGLFPNGDGEYVFYDDFSENPMPFPPEYRYGFNDSLQMTVSFKNLPTFHFLVLNNSVVENGVVSIAKPTLAAFIGIDGLFSYGGGFEFDMHGGIEGKFPINERLWSNGMVKVIAGNSPYLNFEYSADLGIQLSDKAAVIPQLKLYQHLGLKDRYSNLYGKFRTTLDLNISDNFSMDIYGIVSESNEYSLDCSAGFTVNFHW